MSGRRNGAGGLVAGLVAGVVLLMALGLIGFGLMRMTAAPEATPFRSACQGDEACRAALAERLPSLQAVPGGAAAALHEALTRSAPALAPDATPAACQATGAPEACALDPAKLKPGEAGGLIAILDAHSLTVTRQARGCRTMEGCATRALAALGEYGFDPVRLQGALQRTSLPLPPALRACADAGADGVRGACGAEGLLRAAPEPLTVALEQDWRSGGAQARLPQPADPQAELIRNALWAGLGAALGMLLVGGSWVATAALRRGPGKGGLTEAAQPGPLTAGTADMPALARRPSAPPAAEPSPRPARPVVSRRATGGSEAPPPAARVAEAAAEPATPAAPAPRPAPRRASSSESAAAPASPAIAAFHAALSIAGDAATFARLASDEGARLPAGLSEGERAAAGAILAAHRLRGDRPAEAHAGAYDDLVRRLAGPDHRLAWPRPGAPVTPEMETCDGGELYSHAVEAVVRPGLLDGSGVLVLRPRVRAR